ncbi:hypothetical protein IG631_10297 [Alternaria alternata]|nr:hypothetical protein IG631_10297 [Alternaria alternata]
MCILRAILRIHPSSWLVAAETICAAVQNGPSNICGAHEGVRLTTVCEVGEAQRNGKTRVCRIASMCRLCYSSRKRYTARISTISFQRDFCLQSKSSSVQNNQGIPASVSGESQGSRLRMRAPVAVHGATPKSRFRKSPGRGLQNFLISSSLGTLLGQRQSYHNSRAGQ